MKQNRKENYSAEKEHIHTSKVGLWCWRTPKRRWMARTQDFKSED